MISMGSTVAILRAQLRCSDTRTFEPSRGGWGLLGAVSFSTALLPRANELLDHSACSLIVRYLSILLDMWVDNIDCVVGSSVRYSDMCGRAPRIALRMLGATKPSAKQRSQFAITLIP